MFKSNGRERERVREGEGGELLFVFPIGMWTTSSPGVVNHLHEVTVWVTVWENDKQKQRLGIPKEIWRVPFHGIYMYSEGLKLI